MVVELRQLKQYAGHEVTVQGWMAAKRSLGPITFLQLRDGTGFAQGIVERDKVSPQVWDTANSLTIESAVESTGLVAEHPRHPGEYELHITQLAVRHLAEEYPIGRKEHGPEFLHDHRHLWIRSQKQCSLLRVRHEVEQAIRDYFYQNGFVLADSPIFMGSICEDAASLFATDYFDLGKAYLSQSGQLYQEATCMALRKTYCFGPTFRAEKSKTRRHLTEFWMVEAEMAYADFQDLLVLIEDFVRSTTLMVVQRAPQELAFLGREAEYFDCIKEPFHRITYDEILRWLRERGHDIEPGRDLGADEETAVGEGFGKPVFIYRYPKHLRPFYMKVCEDDPNYVWATDLIAPHGYGEIVGGSQREDNLEVLLARIREWGLPEEAYRWYLDLRRYGSVPHAGFGLGIERTTGWIAGVHHIREVIPFPRTILRLEP